MTTPSVSEYPPLVELGRTLAFFTSVIKSGEPWTATCQRDYDRANLALQALAHLPAGSEAVKPLEPVAYHVTKPGEINDYLSFFHLSAGDIADGYQERALVYAAPPSTPPAANVQDIEAAYREGWQDRAEVSRFSSVDDAWLHSQALPRSKQAPTVTVPDEGVRLGEDEVISGYNALRELRLQGDPCDMEIVQTILKAALRARAGQREAPSVVVGEDVCDDAFEEVAQRLEGKASAIEQEEREARTWGGPDPRGRHAEESNLSRARLLRELARETRTLAAAAPTSDGR